MPGGRYPSVTQVLGVFADFAGVPEQVLQHAAERGTKAHAACEAHLKGLWVPPLDDEVQPFFDSFRRWADAMVAEVLWCEGRLTHEIYKYTGKPDLICIVKGDTRPTVIDLKTPVAKGPLWAAQLAAYRELWLASSDHDDARCASLRIRREPGARAIFDEYSGADSARDFQAFLHALYAYRWFKRAA